MKNKNIALGAVIGALYVVLVIGLGPISFLQIQFRVANALIGLVPLIGVPAVFGISVGVLIGNISSPLGPLDLVSFIPTFVGCMIIYRLRHVSVSAGLAIYSVILSIWVAFLLQYVIGVPYIPTVLYLLIGIGVVTIGFGYILYKALIKIGGERFWLQ
jgi:uncharacterized membrane protein